MKPTFTTLSKEGLMMRKVCCFFTMTMLWCIPITGFTQTSNEEILESIWRLDTKEFLPPKYGLAFEGTKELLYVNRGLGSLNFSGVLYCDVESDFRVNAYYSQKIDLVTFEPRPSSWRVAVISDAKQTYKIGDNVKFEYDLSKAMTDSEKEQLKSSRRLVYRFDPQILPIAPSSFSDVHDSSTNMIFSLYECGKLVKNDEIGGRVATEWRVGSRLASKVTIEFERMPDGVLLPVTAKWGVPFSNGKYEGETFVTSYVVKTEWMRVSLNDGTKNYWLPKSIVSSRRLGINEVSKTVDTEYKLYWSLRACGQNS
jgi:hypothetical protein